MRKLLGTILIAAAALSARGAFYGFVTSACSQPVLFRCSDGETLEFVGVVPDFVKWGAVQGKDQVLHTKLEL